MKNAQKFPNKNKSVIFGIICQSARTIFCQGTRANALKCRDTKLRTAPVGTNSAVKSVTNNSESYKNKSLRIGCGGVLTLETDGSIPNHRVMRTADYTPPARLP